MPWKKVLPMEEKMAFILKIKDRSHGFAAICRMFGVSRRIGYKWWRRYQADGIAGLRERSHRPQHCPHAVDPQWTDRLIALRLRHPHWGPKKLRAKLLACYGSEGLPAASTLGAKLKAHGLVRPRRRRRVQLVVEPGVLTQSEHPNHVWAVDFKGWFRTGDGQRCDPLTISDLHSRYVLCCELTAHQSYEAARPVFERVFARFGLPEVIRSDNGGPFGSRGAGGLSRLSAWWICLGIKPEFIAPGHPEQNGIHERMHRTLKAETAQPPAANAEAQQKRFERWRQQFNEDRPHEALGQDVPAMRYKSSPRRLEGAERSWEYPPDYLVRRIRSDGMIKWRGGKRHVSEALVGQSAGLRPVANGQLEVWFADYLIGILQDHESGRFRPSVSSLRTRQTNKKPLPMCPV